MPDKSILVSTATILYFVKHNLLVPLTAYLCSLFQKKKKKKKNTLAMRMFVHLPAFQTVSLDSPKTLPLKNN